MFDNLSRISALIHDCCWCSMNCSVVSIVWVFAVWFPTIS